MHFNVTNFLNPTFEILLKWLPGRRLITVRGGELAYGEEGKRKQLSIQIFGT